jgi:hypothetical protein
MKPLPEAVEVLHKLFGYLDEQRYDELLGLFTANGEWLRKGKWCKGRHEILASLNNRPTSQRICHIITNPYLELYTDNSALLVSYLTTYKSEEDPAVVGTPLIQGPSSLFKTRTELALDEGAWRIARQSSTLQFKFEAPTHTQTNLYRDAHAGEAGAKQ